VRRRAARPRGDVARAAGRADGVPSGRKLADSGNAGTGTHACFLRALSRGARAPHDEPGADGTRRPLFVDRCVCLAGPRPVIAFCGAMKPRPARPWRTRCARLSRPTRVQVLWQARSCGRVGAVLVGGMFSPTAVRAYSGFAPRFSRCTLASHAHSTMLCDAATSARARTPPAARHLLRVRPEQVPRRVLACTSGGRWPQQAATREEARARRRRRRPMRAAACQSCVGPSSERLRSRCDARACRERASASALM
jgi:hypothetical protein